MNVGSADVVVATPALRGYKTGSSFDDPMRQHAGCAAAALALLLGAPAGAVVWEDAAATAGVSFRHAGEVHPARPEGPGSWPAFAEVIGAGACWADFDADGYDDLYLATQQYNPHNPAVGAWAQEADPHGRLYLNDGDGTFSGVAADAGVGTRAFAFGCSAADYDGDGCVDLFVSVFGASELYRNRCDGTFANVTATAAAGTLVGTPDACDPDHPCMATSSAWADYDRDGDLDLYVGTYVNTNLTDLARNPQQHIAQLNWLLRNDGDGTFSDVAASAGVAGNPTDADGSKTLGVVWLDYDRDGWTDLYVANDETPNHLFRNLGDGTFADVAADAGVADPRASMGLAARDYDNDGWPDLFMTHYDTEHNGFYRNRGDGTFEDRSGEDDLAHSLDKVGWGTDFVDVDRDGWLDIVLANGHTEWDLPEYNQSLQVFHSAPEPSSEAPPWDRRWTEVTDDSGSGVLAVRVHRGAAFADFDLDGDSDIALNNNGNETAQLLRASGLGHGWLNVRLAQPGGNRFGVGARIEVEAAGLLQAREVQAGSSYLSQNTLTQEFGLGDATRADVVIVHWPGGSETHVGPLAANQTVRIDRDGTWTNDTLSPRTRAVLEGTPGHRGWWRSPVRATLDAQDRGSPFASGVALTEASRDGAPWTPAEGPLEFGEGDHVLRMRSRDRVGNQEPPRSQGVRVDLTMPALDATLEGARGSEGWWVSAVRVSLTASDPLSGVERLRYRADGGPWTDYEAPFLLEGEGVHGLEYSARDLAGNEALATARVPIDLTPPAPRFVHPRGGSLSHGDEELAAAGAGPAVVAAPGGGTLHVRAEAPDAASGTARVDFTLDGRPVASRDAEPFAWSWDLGSAATGPHTLGAQATDHAGHRGEVRLVVVAATAAPRAPPDPWLELALPGR